MNLWQNYIRPKNLTEAMDAFANAPRPLLPIAGGTDLLLDLEQGRHAPVQTLVDVTSIAEMTRLEIIRDELFIGASVSVNRVATTPEVAHHAQALTEACNLIAGPQVRNVATLGGNVAHALPAADGTIALLALNAIAEIASATGTRRIPFNELFFGPGKSSLKHGEELIVGFYLPLSKNNQASCFQRIMRPQGVALPILNCAVWLNARMTASKIFALPLVPAAGLPSVPRKPKTLCVENLSTIQHLNLHLMLCLLKLNSAPVLAVPARIIADILSVGCSGMWLSQRGEERVTTETRRH